MTKRLIAIAEPSLGLRVENDGLMRSLTGAKLGALGDVLHEHRARLLPLRREGIGGDPGVGISGTDFFSVVADVVDARALTGALRGAGMLAFDNPRPVRPVFRSDMRPTGTSPVPQGPTPDLEHLQRYLGLSPEGFDVHEAWRLAGGTGVGVRIVDVEGGWRLNHEGLAPQDVGTLGVEDEDQDVAHGTAVLGVLGAARTGRGTVGIAPNARLGVCADYLPETRPFRTTSAAIKETADALQPGDILVIEAQILPKLLEPLEGATLDRVPYVPVERLPDVWFAIKHATSRGILVVAAAGNGYQNLDDPIFDQPDEGFPLWWRNPFRRGEMDSGSILVGAGAPPLDVPRANANEGKDRSRMSFSNYGSAVDAQGWGDGVATCGYGDLQGSLDESSLTRWYTAIFNGTSSATPCVAGALACVQGILRARGKPILTPEAARELLRATGSPQQEDSADALGQRIGNRPSILQMLSALGI